jgi:hypothetical protein
MRAKAALVPTLAVVARSRWQYGKAADALDREKADHIRSSVNRFVPVCTRELSNGSNGLVRFIHQPDCGFRRTFLIDTATALQAPCGPTRCT